jgi:hypothetical protein
VSVAIAGVGVLSASSRLTPPDTRSFLFGSGNDTGRETFTRTATSLSGDMTFSTMRMHYDAKLSPDGTIPRLDVRTTTSGAKKQPPRLTSVIVGRDSTEVIEQQAGKTQSVRVATQPGLLPLINLSVGLTEIVVARARRQRSPSVMVPALIAADMDSLSNLPLRARAATGPIVVTFLRGDTVMIGTSQPKNQKDKVRLITDPDGRIRSVMNGADAKDRFTARRTSP